MNRFDKLDAKTTNEQLKAIATFTNALSVGTVVAGGIAPLANDKPPSAWMWFFLFAGAAVLHGVAHLVLTYLVSEE